jgi:hypothetical protein
MNAFFTPILGVFQDPWVANMAFLWYRRALFCGIDSQPIKQGRRSTLGQKAAAE